MALAAMDVLVCASREEGFSLAVAEAMAAGVPVVATRCGGPEELICDGVSGLLVPREDPAALAMAVGALAGDTELGQRLAAEARRVHGGRFTAAAGVRRFGAFLQALGAGARTSVEASDGS